MGSDGVDRELADDVVGTASARLLAAGVPRRDRLEALRLLGILAGVADGDGLVRHSLAHIAREFALPAAAAERSLERLIEVGAAGRSSGGLTVAGAEPAPRGALRLEDFLSAASDLDDARRRRLTRWRATGAVAGVAAAAVLAVLGVAPAIVRQETVPATADRPAAPRQHPSGDDERVDEALSALSEPASDARSGPDDTAGGPTGLPPSALAPAPAGTDRTVTATGPTECPHRVPAVGVSDVVRRADGTWVVDGTVRNPTTAAVTIGELTVTLHLDGAPVTMPGVVSAPVAESGGEVAWRATVPVGLPLAEAPRASVLRWSWSWEDPRLARCPSA